jgi:phosphoribosylaminoimidazole-succinocarboxamide synthase
MPTILAEGKTKVILRSARPGYVEVRSKKDITAGDGKKHDLMDGKAELATRTNTNVMSLLRRHDIEVAFEEQIDPITFRAKFTRMIPFEVVVRHKSAGSDLERNPHHTKYQDLPMPVEFYLKTSGKQWRGISIPVDDPYVIDTGVGKLELYDPHQPVSDQVPFLVIVDDFSSSIQRALMAGIALDAAATIATAWAKIGGIFIDIKFEFGLDEDGYLLLSDVVDNDSWRVLFDGVDISKQAYREGADLPSVKGKYELVAQLTDQF